MSIYAHTLTKNTGEPQEMESYRGKLLLIVNTASKCGFTKQYEGLENLYSRYKDKGFEILGFPCDQFGHQEPGSDEEIAAFCNINFGVSFSLFKKTDVNGPQTHPMYVELKDQAPGLLGSKRIKWNFTKFLVSKDGTVVKRYAPTTKPEDIAKDIESHLA
ncbi:glutathione peroxidase [Alteromonas australica]|jgi:glutathione peroxidase|uniref:glutathione peroxidase n=1 Tax=Alteromonas TaxID=226 RepID=UPI0005C41DA7|nr:MULTISPECIES: glutathione peroxidase [Alteromonas]MAB92498.1 glutathione peroxidase [Alteromonas sp.]AJP43919.1 glutathione peroxidase [Alteromonas australica]MAB92786.1 glutathione peroxidase [Alteromonas sp.]MAO29812.1 glutathione peroxidase [Alteromonas sp.]QPL51738.1 glutathione peroxidase [Alteromonas sp. B31-7]|tara:strand:- start:6916 stop:7395 length:480 start_codon:yes stop_codon:yes gene_type:complete